MIRLLSLLLLAFPAFADPVMITDEERPNWLAVGRVNVGGFDSKALCSGALIAPTAVLTAAHCVAGTDGTPHLLTKVRFVAGWHKGEFASVGKAKAINVHPDYGKLRAGSIARVETDLAVIILEDPMQDITPLPVDLTGQVQDDETIKMLGYRRDRPHILTDYQGCSAYLYRKTMLSIDCDVIQGTSGAPVLAERDGVWHIIGVVSSRIDNRGRDKALAALPGSLKSAIEAEVPASIP